MESKFGLSMASEGTACRSERVRSLDSKECLVVARVRGCSLLALLSVLFGGMCKVSQRFSETMFMSDATR